MTSGFGIKKKKYYYTVFFWLKENTSCTKVANIDLPTRMCFYFSKKLSVRFNYPRSPHEKI